MILVTGATGFLGKRVCKKLRENGKEFIKTSFSMGTDLRKQEEIFRLFEEVKPEYVLHCASYVGGIQFGMKHAGELFYNNMLMSVNLLEACRMYEVKRLVNPISNCAYPGEATYFKEEEFWNGPLHDSVAVYGMVRKMSYVGAKAYWKQYGVDTINIILSNMYGPEDHFEEERSHALGALIMKMVEARNNSKPSVVVWGTGKPVREWLYVDDGAEAMIRSMCIAQYDEPINIGVGKGISIYDMAVLIKDATGYQGDLLFDPTKPDGALYKTVDGSRGAERLQWHPEKNFKEGVYETVRWYEEKEAKHKKAKE